MRPCAAAPVGTGEKLLGTGAARFGATFSYCSRRRQAVPSFPLTSILCTSNFGDGQSLAAPRAPLVDRPPGSACLVAQQLSGSVLCPGCRPLPRRPPLIFAGVLALNEFPQLWGSLRRLGAGVSPRGGIGRAAPSSGLGTLSRVFCSAAGLSFLSA